MPDPSPSADAALRRIDDDIAAAQQRAVQATDYRRDTEAMRGEATVNGVSVTVDSTGLLVDLDLGRLHEGQSPSALRATILSAYAAAQRDVSTRLRDKARESFGTESATTRRIEQEIDQHFRAV